MKSWKVISPNNLVLEETTPQLLSDDCVKLKMLKSSISYTDILIYMGEINTVLPITIGRQGIGLITEVGASVKNFVRGDRVVLQSVIPCGQCFDCNSGAKDNCHNMLTNGLNDEGFLKDFLVTNPDNLQMLPPSVRDDEAVFIEHLSIAIKALDKLNIEKGEHVVIVGASVIGIILAQLAMYYQAVPILVDVRQERLDLAKSLGIYYTINSVQVDTYKKVQTLTGGRLAECCVYMLGSSLPLNLSIDLVARGGKMVLCGWSKAFSDISMNIVPLVEKQIVVHGVNNGHKNIASAINLLANKVVSVLPLISREVQFSEVESAMKEIVAYPDKDIKVLVKI